MKMLECPKCGETIVQPQWHMNCSKLTTKYVNVSDKEHLHYLCKCGYDFITDIHKEDLVDDN